MAAVVADAVIVVIVVPLPWRHQSWVRVQEHRSYGLAAPGSTEVVVAMTPETEEEEAAVVAAWVEPRRYEVTDLQKNMRRTEVAEVQEAMRNYAQVDV